MVLFVCGDSDRLVINVACFTNNYQLIVSVTRYLNQHESHSCNVSKMYGPVVYFTVFYVAKAHRVNVYNIEVLETVISTNTIICL